MVVVVPCQIIVTFQIVNQPAGHINNFNISAELNDDEKNATLVWRFVSKSRFQKRHTSVAFCIEKTGHRFNIGQSLVISTSRLTICGRGTQILKLRQI